MKKIRLALIRAAVFVCIFLISLKVIGGILNRGNTDLTTDMPSAYLPVVYMNINDIKMNALHGYTTHMEGGFLRGMITPINADRSLDIIVDTLGTSIAKVSFEVRNIDCSRLIETGEIESFDFNDNIITTKLFFKDLIDDETEYMLIVKLTTGDGNIIDYYSRIINTTELHLVDKIQFCSYFSDTTFDQAKAPELKKYMESNSYGDNSSYGYVNIHSSYNQLSWGELNPELIGEKNIKLISIDSLTGCIELDYRVLIKNEIYNVKEYFRVQMGKDRMYLMEYERTMNQVISNEEKTVINHKIINGIVNEEIKYTENPDGSIVSFVQQDTLYSFNAVTGQLARIFSFRDSENDDARTNYNAHSLKVMSMDEAGNTNFIVYGYMNRGPHEGQVGLALYYYDAVINTIEEQLFIPYTKSFEILEKDIEKLSYINDRSKMYVLMDGAVYSINLESKDVENVAKNLDENRFVSSNDNSIIAWQEGNGIIDFNTIQYYALDDLSPKLVKAPSGCIISPLGFIGNDLVYGTARISDLTTDLAGRTIIPMHKLTIESISGVVMKEYSKDNVYVSDVQISDEMINLERLTRDEESGQYAEIANDQIMANDKSMTRANVYKSVITEEMETTYQIVLSKEGNYDSVKVLTPKSVLFEDNRVIELNGTDTKDRYYVYAKGELQGIYTDAKDAVILADDMYGVVVNKKMGYVWESGHRKNSVKIETINGAALSEEQIEAGMSSLKVCIEKMLEYNEIYKDKDTLLRGTDTVLSVLDENLNADVLDLTGCSLDCVLYYVSRLNPVLAMTEGGEAVLIVGYDAKNTILYSPLSGEVFKKGMNDSREYFESCGNKYISYVE